MSKFGNVSECRFLSAKGVLLFSPLLACILVAACKNPNPQVIWSAERPSPDGSMVAKANAFANGGFGMSGTPATYVYWNWAKGSQKPMLILSLEDESDSIADADVEINWLSPLHLEVTYRSDRQHVTFQAVRCGKVDISLRDLAAGENNNPGPK